MKLGDFIRFGFSNLWRTKLRTGLTTLGVTIGIGALVSMVSFGTGMQKNITRIFYENDLFSSLRVFPGKVNLDDVMEGNIGNLMEKPQKAITDSVLEAIRAYPEVDIAFPEIRFAAKIRYQGRETKTTIRALPAAMAKYKPYDKLFAGNFFDSDTASSLIIGGSLLRQLGIRVEGYVPVRRTAPEDSLRRIRTLPVDSLIGQPFEIVTSVVDIGSIMRNPMQTLSAPQSAPFRESVSHFTVRGILPLPLGFDEGRFGGEAVIPMESQKRIPRLGFTNVWSLLDAMGKSDGMGSLYVRVKKIPEIKPVRERIESMGYGVVAISDQLEEIKQGFLLLNTALGAVGTIALIVAALGIVNTMVMSILERTREIGIMKAVGGSENQIQSIFFIEAGIIGCVGGGLGLALGWVVTRIANMVANLTLAKQEIVPIDFFYIPAWLILGALAFSIGVSLAAGMYPALRASRIDPVQALRHD